MIDDGELRARMAARGAPAAVADTVSGLYAAARAGGFARVDPTLGRLIGRAPTRTRAVMAERLG